MCGVSESLRQGQSLTVDILSEGVLPAVHLDELYAHQDLIHQPHSPVSHRHALLAEIRRQSGCEHLTGTQEVMTRGEQKKKKVAREEMKAGTITLSALRACLRVVAVGGCRVINASCINTRVYGCQAVLVENSLYSADRRQMRVMTLFKSGSRVSSIKSESKDCEATSTNASMKPNFFKS